MTRQTPPSAGTAERARWLPAALLVGAVLSLVMMVFHAHNPVSGKAADYARTVSVTSAGTYVGLRTLNAFLSTAQEVEFSGGFILSGSAQPFKVLEPVDDTIERVADAVFALMVFSGVLAVAMGPVGAVGFAMLAGSLIVWWLSPGRMIGRRLAVYGLFLALALPLSFLLSSGIAERMTQEVWAENTAVIERITAPLDIADTGTGWADQVRKRVAEAEGYGALAGAVYDQADDLIASYVAILAVFVFRIFLLPALLAGGFFVAARWLAEPERCTSPVSRRDG